MGQIKHILVTGSNGFLGSFVVRRLLEEGFSPILYLRASSNTWRINDVLDQCIVYRSTGKVGDVENVFKAYPITCVVHLATDYGRGKSLVDLLSSNILFPISLIEEGIKHQLKLFINTDSFFAKKNYDQSYLKEYTNSKRALAQLLNSFTGKLKVANLRLEHVYGENDAEEKFFTSIIKRLLQNEPFIELTEGIQKRDFTYAKDIANAYITIIENFDALKEHEEYEVGTGKSIAVRTFIEKIAAAANSNTELRFGALPTRPGDIQDSYANLENLKSIGWKQQYTVDEAINHIIKEEKLKL